MFFNSKESVKVKVKKKKREYKTVFLFIYLNAELQGVSICLLFQVQS